MRRILSLFCLTGVLLFLLGGCVGKEGGLLSYAPRLLSAEIGEGGRLWRVTPTEGGFAAVLLSPEGAAGITLRLTDTEASAFAGEVKIPLGGRMFGSAARLLTLFAYGEEDITDIRSDPQTEGVQITFSDGTLALLDKEGNPLSFRCGGSCYTVTALEWRSDNG